MLVFVIEKILYIAESVETKLSYRLMAAFNQIKKFRSLHYSLKIYSIWEQQGARDTKRKQSNGVMVNLRVSIEVCLNSRADVFGF